MTIYSAGVEIDVETVSSVMSDAFHVKIVFTKNKHN